MELLNETLVIPEETIKEVHRIVLGGVMLADKIVVLSNGRLVEEGTHDELVKSGGLYAKIRKEQAGAYMM